MPGAANMSVREAATHYASLGIKVIPLHGIENGRCTCGKPNDAPGHKPGKHPVGSLTPNGADDATCDPEQIRLWFGGTAQLNLGLVLGDLVAIDEDRPGAILAAGIELPNCPASKTGRGLHYIFRANGVALQNGDFAPGLECKTGNGYIVAPPSLHLFGHRYAWVEGHSLDDIEPPDLPDDVARMIVAAHAKANGAAKDSIHDLFGRLKLEPVFAELEQLRPDQGARWRDLMLRLVRSLVGRGLRDEMILTLMRRTTRRDLGYTHEQTDAWVADEIRRIRHKDNRPEPEEFTFDQDDTKLEQEQVDQTRQRLRLVPPSEMSWRGAQLNLVKDLLGFAMMALIYGESGSAKTLIAMSIALHVALGLAWCGRAVKQGLVVYLAPEGGSSVHLRFHAWCRYHGIDPNDDRMLFRTVPVQMDLRSSSADLSAIVANVKDKETELGAACILIVVDTVSRALSGGDENSPEGMGSFLINCDRLRQEIGATVLAVHHVPKGGSTPRGHSSLMNGSDIRMSARKITNGLFSMTLDHLKDGEAGGEMLFNLHKAVVGQNDEGEDVTGGLVTKATIIAAGTPGRPHGKLNERQLRILQELQKEAATTKRWEFTTEQFNELCIRSGAVDHTKPENQQRARCSDLRTQLANRRLITVSGDTIRLVVQP